MIGLSKAEAKASAKFGAQLMIARAPNSSNLPGVRVGDFRSGSLKLVASPVGEGAIPVAVVHQALRE
jgi:hypothetical protein